MALFDATGHASDVLVPRFPFCLWSSMGNWGARFLSIPVWKGVPGEGWISIDITALMLALSKSMRYYYYYHPCLLFHACEYIVCLHCRCVLIQAVATIGFWAMLFYSSVLFFTARPFTVD